MDADSSKTKTEAGNNNEERRVIAADELNRYASEFFYVNDWAEKYSSRMSLTNTYEDAAEPHVQAEHKVQAPEVQVETEVQVEPEVQAKPEVQLARLTWTERKVKDALDVRLGLDVKTVDNAESVQAGAGNASSAPVVNFWTTPVKFRNAKPTSTIVNFKPGEATFENCSCGQCTGEHNVVTTSGAGLSRMEVVKALAPMGWCALFIVCSVSLIAQLSAMAQSNCAATKQLCDRGKYQEALNASSLAIRCNPFMAAAYYERARVLTHMMRYREAKDCLDQCLTLAPEKAQALDARAALSLKIGQPEQTIADTNRLMTLKGGRLTGVQYGNMAVAYYKSGKYDEAIGCYDKALAADRASLTLELGKTYCLSGKQQHKQALASCDRLLKTYGARSQVIALHGYCLERLHDLAGAERDFDAALAAEPKSPSIYGFRANLMKEMGRNEAACRDYVAAAELDRDNAVVQYTAAKMLKDIGRNWESLAYYERLEHFPSFVYSAEQHDERAALNYSAGRYEECLSDLNRAMALKPESDLNARKALCLAHLGRDREARASVALAKSGAHGAQLLLTEAQVDAILGQTVSAVDKYTRVLNIDATNKEALTARGGIYYARGQWASAAADYHQLVSMGAGDSQDRAKLNRCRQLLANGAKISLDLPTQKIIDMTELTVANLSDKGRKAFVDGDMQVAALYFAELVKRQPGNVGARKSLGHSLECAGEHAQAVAIFEPMSTGNQLALSDQFCYAHALAASGMYDRSISIMQRLHHWEPSNMAYRLELTKLLSAAGQIDNAIGMCRDSLAMGGSSEERRNLNNVYESLMTEKQRSKKSAENGGASGTESNRAETQG